MIGALLRILAWFVILATLLSACAPTIRLDEATADPTDPDLLGPAGRTR